MADVPLPAYSLYLIGLTILTLVLILIYLLYLLRCKRQNTIHTAPIRESSGDQPRVTYKPSSFHLPLIHIHKFEKIFNAHENTEIAQNENNKEHKGEEPSHSKGYTVNINERIPKKDNNKFEKLSDPKEYIPKRNNIESNQEHTVKSNIGYKIPEPIAIIPPDKMKDICYGVIKKAGLKSKNNNCNATYDTPNDSLYRRPKILSSPKLIEKSSSVPELDIYDDVSNSRSVKFEIFSSFDDSELTKPKMKGIKLVTDSHYGYNFPLYVELMYENANSKPK